MGVLLGLEPFSQPLFYLIAPLCLIALTDELADAGWRARVLWSVLACLSVSIFAFQWVAVALAGIGQLPWPAAIALFLGQAPFLNLKIVLVILGGSWFLHGPTGPRTRLGRPWIFGGLGLAGDLFAYQAFPWYWGNLAGADPLLRQSAFLGGIFLLSFLVFSGSAALLDITRARLRRAAITRTLVLPLLPLLLAYGFGVIRISTADLSGPTVRVGFFQPATGPASKEEAGDYVTRALNLAFNYGLKTIIDEGGRLDLLLIPETAVPFLSTNPNAANRAAGLYSPTYHGVVAFLARYGDVDVFYNELEIIARDETQTDVESTAATNIPPPIHNLGTIYGREGRRRGSYIKQRLVPFGEYLPGESALPFLRALLPEASNYRPGGTPMPVAYEYRTNRAPVRFLPPTPDEMNSLSDPELIESEWPEHAPGSRGYFLPLICYEGMFPDLVRDFFHGPDAPPPDFLVNISNDAWFGDYLTNWQHFEAVRMRAIETNRYFVRSTLTGAGGVIDPLGRNVIPPTPLGRPAIRTADVPRRPNAWSPYLTVGEWPLYMLLIVLISIGYKMKRDD